MTDTQRLDWLEKQYTLHNGVDILYVVDGYCLSMIERDEVVVSTFHGETLRDAIDKASYGIPTA